MPSHLKKGFFVFVVLATGFLCQAPTPPSIPTALPKVKDLYWQLEARKTFADIELMLKRHHPGSLDRKFSHFHYWQIQGKKEFQQRLKYIQTYPDYFFALNAFVSGFRDIHCGLLLSRYPFGKIQEWPGFLMQYDGKNFVIKESCTKTIPNESIVTKIDGITVKAWIDRNIAPFESTPPQQETTYWITSPITLLWQCNPFIPKPVTISIFKDAASAKTEVSIPLRWQKISSENFRKKFKKITEVPSWREQFDPITTKDLTSEITYVKIPTFSITPGTLAFKMFLRSTRKLQGKRLKKALIFDLRGNGGGLAGLTDRALEQLYGGPAATAAREQHKTGLGFNLSPETADMVNFSASMMPTEKLVTFSDEMEHSFDSDQPMLIEKDWDFNNELVRLSLPAPKEPVGCKMYVVIDGGTNSASLYMIDLLNIITNNNVTLIGQPSGVDTAYTNPRIFAVHRGSLVVPTLVQRGRTRGDNEPFRPKYPLSNIHMQDSDWLKRKLVEIVELDMKKNA